MSDPILARVDAAVATAAPGNASRAVAAALGDTGGPPPLVLYKTDKVTDHQVINGVYTSAAVGLLCILGFILGRTFIPFYTARTRLRGVLVRPPPLATRGVRAAFAWLVPVFTVSDADLVRTAGLDALMVHRALGYGVLWLGPYAAVCCAILLPLYARGSTWPRPPPKHGAVDPLLPGDGPDTASPLGRFVVGALPTGSPYLWIPALVTAAGVAYGLWLISAFLSEFTLLRQAYLAAGDAALAGAVAPPEALAAASTGAPRAAREADLAARQRRLPVGREESLPVLSGEEEEEDGEGESGDDNDHPPPLVLGDDTHPPPPSPPPSHPPVSPLETDADAARPALIDPWWTGASDGRGARRPPVALVKAARAAGGRAAAPSVAAELYCVLATDVPPPPTPRLHGARSTLGAAGLACAAALPASIAGAGALCAGPLVSFAASGFDGDDDAELAPSLQGAGRAASSVRLAPGSAAAAVRRRTAAARGRVSDTESGAADSAAPRLAAPPSPEPKPDRGAAPPAAPLAPALPPRPWFRGAARLGGAALVDAVFSRLAPGDYHGAVAVVDVRPAHRALCAWEKARVALEKAENAALAADAAGAPRPRVGGPSWWHRLLGKPPPPSIDAVDAAAARVRDAEDAVAAAQAAAAAAADRPAPSYIAFFATQTAAAAAAAVPPFPQGWRRAFRVLRAPGPDEVCWQQLFLSPAQRARSTIVGVAWLAAFCLFPIGFFAGALSNIEHFACAPSGAGRVPRNVRAAFCDRSSFLRSLITGTLPPLLVAMWSCLVMPKALYRGVLLLGVPDASLSGVDRRVFWAALVWTLVTVNLGAVLGGSALLVLPSLLRDPATAYKFIGRSLAAASNFFVNFLVQQALLMAPFRLLWPCSAPLKHLLRVVARGLTPPRARRAPRSAAAADHAGAAALPHVSLRAGRELGAVVAGVYVSAAAAGVVAPLSLPFAFAWCCVAWTVWRYQLLYVFERAYEGGGAIFFEAAAGLAAILAAHSFFTGCVLVACGAFTAGGALAVLGPVACAVSHSRTAHRYGARAAAPPSLLAATAPRARVDPRAYTPPALRPRAAGWQGAGTGCGWSGWKAPPFFPG